MTHDAQIQKIIDQTSQCQFLADALRKIGDIVSRELAEPSGNDTKALVEICTIAEAGNLLGVPSHEAQIAALREALEALTESCVVGVTDEGIADVICNPLVYRDATDCLSDTAQAAADYEQRIKEPLEKQIERLAKERDDWNAAVPNKCPITGYPFFSLEDHPDHGIVPTYGGPFDSYTIPEWDGEDFVRSRFDHDAGGWHEESECLGWLDEKLCEAMEQEEARIRADERNKTLTEAIACAIGCKDYRGGYDEPEMSAFHHGMEVVAITLTARRDNPQDTQSRVVLGLGQAELASPTQLTEAPE